AGDENPARPARKAENLAHPFNDLTFDLDRNVIAPAEIGVQPSRQHLRQHADGGAAAMHPSHEARVNIARRTGDDEIGEFPIDLSEIGGFKWELCAKPRADSIRYRSPDRAIADVGGVVEHVIEHAMTSCADIVPVLRIERLARFGLRGCFTQCPCHAASSRPCRARRYSMLANASKIACICGGLEGNGP